MILHAKHRYLYAIFLQKMDTQNLCAECFPPKYWTMLKHNYFYNNTHVIMLKQCPIFWRQTFNIPAAHAFYSRTQAGTAKVSIF